MSRFLDERYSNITPYRLGEQPTDREYIKLNSNESSYALSDKVSRQLVELSASCLGYYSDQDCTVLAEALAERLGVGSNQIFIGNGADEVLSFCFQAYCLGEKGLAFPDITYGFYKVFAQAYGVKTEVIPLDEDFRVRPADYTKTKKNIVLANPNAPTGLSLTHKEIEKILASRPDRIVIIDEAYVDFGGESCIPLIQKYPNLIVVHTMSKSRGIAGIHVGYAVASPEIAAELNAIKNCFNPNNVNQITIDTALASVRDDEYVQYHIRRKIETRDRVIRRYRELGFSLPESRGNFVFVTHPRIHARDLERQYRSEGVLTRYYNAPRIDNYLRISIGSPEEMETVLAITETILDRIESRKEAI